MGNIKTNKPMKYFVIAALLGLTAAFKENNFVQRLEKVKDVTVIQMEESDSDSDDDNTHVGLAADGKYERVVPPHFSADSDDLFMRSMIRTYAHEKRTPIEELDDGTKIGGEPTGSFRMS